MEKDSCPMCGALPADWVSDPHERNERANQIIVAFHALTSGIAVNGTWCGRDAGQWAYSARQWILNEPE